jgi:hypothetical protein
VNRLTVRLISRRGAQTVAGLEITMKKVGKTTRNLIGMMIMKLVTRVRMKKSLLKMDA